METDSAFYLGILIILSGMVGGLLYIVNSQGKRLADSIPPSTLTLLNGALELAGTLAKLTPTLQDDKLVETLQGELKPTEPPA